MWEIESADGGFAAKSRRLLCKTSVVGLRRWISGAAADVLDAAAAAATTTAAEEGRRIGAARSDRRVVNTFSLSSLSPTASLCFVS